MKPKPSPQLSNPAATGSATNLNPNEPMILQLPSKNTYFALDEDCLRNGSFYRFTGRKTRDQFAHYILGDFHGFVKCLPEDQTFEQWAPKFARPMLPSCFN